VIDDTIRRSVIVSISPERAFAAWTERVDLWWPPSHRQHAKTDAELTFEGRVGGRLFEHADSGDDVEYGRVTTWDPPDVLRYEFFLGTGPDLPTDVSIRFVAVPEGTRVEVEHSAGAAGDAYSRSVSGYRRAWTELLESFTHHAQSGVSP